MRSRFLCQNSLAAVAVTLYILFSAAPAFGQSASFTYQGRLTDSNNPANGNYDIQFALFDNSLGGIWPNRSNADAK